ncbi:MAG: hypothetical protein JWM59_4229 [Verrucomicrobiales bacterium]|nr:hypothetical protein [Verrucomicrobiales bacterium]
MAASPAPVPRPAQGHVPSFASLRRTGWRCGARMPGVACGLSPMAHLHLLLATDSPAAILIKHGPGSGSCTVGWDRERDTFQMGQCLRQRLECPDISPDGRYFSYCVNTWNPHRKHKSYRVISLSPWLKARAFWATGGGDPHPGSSLFLRNNSERPNIFTCNPSLPKWDYLDTKVTSKLPRRWEKFLSPYFQWQRDGWSAVTSGATEQAEPNHSPNWEGRAASLQCVLEKRLPHGWKLKWLVGAEATGCPTEAQPLKPSP